MQAIPTQTLADLHWGQLLEHLGRRARTDLGAARVRAILPCSDRDAASARQQLWVECRDLLEARVAVAFADIRDLRAPLLRSEKGAVLDGEELVAIARAARTLDGLARTLGQHRDRAPSLALLLEEIPDLRPVYERIEPCFGPTSTLLSSASPLLSSLRQRVTQLGRKLQLRTDGLLQNPSFTPHLQDHYVTQRENRYVLPIRADAQRLVPGIVHGASQSGQTVFIEPQEIVDGNNALRLAICEVEAEEHRICAELSAVASRHSRSLALALERAAELDEICAIAQLAIDVEGAPVRWIDDGDLRFPALRHPLLVLAGTPCVANDLELRGHGALVLSGPNAGGKTLALKAVGLAVLMASAGLPVATTGSPELFWLANVRTEIGDQQDLDKGLSTFSAHLRGLQAIEASADARSLVLLDELAVGTAPDQGAALAQALLETLVARRATVVVTTHYLALKNLAAEDPRFRNGSFGFDRESLRPTYQIHPDVPGASGALWVARQVGLPEALLARAECLGSESGRVETLLATLEEKRRHLDEHTTTARAQLAALAEAQRALDEARARLEDEKRRLHRAEYDGALAELRDVREALRQHRAHVRVRQPGMPTPPARPEPLEELARKVHAHAPTRPRGVPLAPQDLVPGARVHVPGLGSNGEILSIVGADRVEVRVGTMRSWVTARDLEACRGPRIPTPTSARSHTLTEAPTDTAADPASTRACNTTCDLRGERVAEAIAQLDRFLDQSVLAGLESVFVIHGHGTGALRRAVREHLQDHPQVQRWVPAVPAEGGDGVTVAFVR